MTLVACQRSADDLREWTPQDHDHTSQPNADQVQVSDAGASPMAALGIDEVTLVTWRQSCVTCHGVVGRGDGPRGAMLNPKPPDLTDPAWQAAITDEAIATAIKNGRGAMPAFDLPDKTVQTLIRLVRLLNRDRLVDGGMGADDADATDATDVNAAADAAPAAVGAADADVETSLPPGASPTPPAPAAQPHSAQPGARASAARPPQPPPSPPLP